MNNMQPSCLAIVGAGSGVGRALALLAAKNGCSTVLLGRTLATLSDTQLACEALGGQAHCHVMNLTVADHCAQMGKRLGRDYHIDGLALVAGTAKLCEIGKSANEAIHDLIHTNLTGPAQLLNACIPTMRKHDVSRIVAVSSLSAQDPFTGLGFYGAAKSGINLLMQATHGECYADGVHAWSVAPGAIETKMLRGLVSEADFPTSMTLSPNDVAEVLWQCLSGQHSTPSGETIWLPSPSA